MVEARLDSSVDGSVSSQAQSPMSTSSPQYSSRVKDSPQLGQPPHNSASPQVTSLPHNSASILGEEMPPLVPSSFSNEPVAVRYSSNQPSQHDIHIARAIDQHLNAPADDSLDLTMNDSVGHDHQNRVVLLESSESSEPSITEIHQEDLKPPPQPANMPPSIRADKRPQPSAKAIKVPQMKIQNGKPRMHHQTRQPESQGNSNHISKNSAKHASNPRRNGLSVKQRPPQPISKQAVRKQHSDPSLAAVQESGTYIKVEEQPHNSRQVKSTRPVNGKLRMPTTQSLAQKRGMRAAGKPGTSYTRCVFACKKKRLFIVGSVMCCNHLGVLQTLLSTFPKM